MKICNESDFLNVDAGKDWLQLSDDAKLSMLCPSNITNMTMQAGQGMYLKSFKFVVD